MIADAQVIALRFNVGVDHLIIEKLRALWLASDAPVIVVQQTTKKAELTLLIQNLDLHEIGKLANECLHPLVKPHQVPIDLRPKQFLHAAVRELRFELVNRTSRIMEELPDRCCDPRLRPGTFKQDAIEKFDLIQA